MEKKEAKGKKRIEVQNRSSDFLNKEGRGLEWETGEWEKRKQDISCTMQIHYDEYHHYVYLKSANKIKKN